MNLSDNLEKIRKQNNLSQEDLAKFTLISFKMQKQPVIS